MRKFYASFVLLFLFTTAFVSQVSYSQVVKSLNVKDVTLVKCLDAIKEQTGLGYLLKDDKVKSLSGISYTGTNVDAAEVLKAILANTGYTFEISDGVILIVKSPKPPAKPVEKPKAEEKKGYSVRVYVTDKATKETLIGAVIMARAYETYAIVFEEGGTSLQNIPPGKVILETQMLGYESFMKEVVVKGDMEIHIQLQETSLALEEVTVVAKASAAGTSTSSTIGRQAMDHLQATSLKDVMQLLPGQLMTGVSGLTSAEKITIRTLSTDNTNNAFGTAIVVDGVPISDNASLENKAGITSTGGTGVDLREIGADNIESIEVIRGIPSAEFGDLTSGAVIVNTKAGQSPLEIRAKINPVTFNTSLSKGWKFADKKGSLNTNLDYAQAWGDPRQKTTSFDRISGGLTYTRTLKKAWYTNTKLNVSNLLDFRGTDPDVLTEGTETTQRSLSLRFSHNGKVSVNSLLMRTLSYSVGVSQSINESRTSTIVASGGGLPIITSLTPGYAEVPYITSSYIASGGTEARPRSVFAKVTNGFFFNYKSIRQRFNMGVEYRMDENNARGFYNDNDMLPIRPNSNGRPRPFYQIPRLNQVSAFLEDNVNIKLGENRHFRLQAGVRFDMLQPGLEEQVSSISPRFNASLKVAEWLEFRGGWGKNSKTPGLSHLYPEPRYSDRLVAQYLPSNPDHQLVMYHTYINYIARNSLLQNSTNTKTEVGVDVKLPNSMTFSVVAYNDKLEGGFGNYTEYLRYYSNFYEVGNGIIVIPDSKPVVDWKNPARVDTVFTTKGIVGNTQVNLNRGIEFDFYLGRVEHLRTQFYLSGAYMESQSWSTGPNFSNPVGIPPSSVYGMGGANTPPFKLEYPSGLQKSIQRRFSNVVRGVYNIPQMRMVASINGQIIWYTYSNSTNQQQKPIGWLDTDLSYHPITEEMFEDPSYTIKGISLADQIRDPKDTEPIVMPPVWLISARLTKEISKSMRISFFTSNLFYYTPYQTSNVSNTPIERNANSFAFGMEFLVKI
ncbi:MAG: TonB-dependent receptor [Tenuifilaceae bacterium]|jgi:outer membrane receptor for ferrienterochelin and colicin|nr:TonB-dependent receptor [Tenuifilaceae bacterium]